MTTAQNLTNWLYLQKCLEGVSLKSESFSLITLSRFRMVEENRRGQNRVKFAYVGAYVILQMAVKEIFEGHF